jgi:hypothetical protein
LVAGLDQSAGDRLAEMAGAADDCDGSHCFPTPEIPNLLSPADCR